MDMAIYTNTHVRLFVVFLAIEARSVNNLGFDLYVLIALLDYVDVCLHGQKISITIE